MFSRATFLFITRPPVNLRRHSRSLLLHHLPRRHSLPLLTLGQKCSVKMAQDQSMTVSCLFQTRLHLSLSFQDWHGVDDLPCYVLCVFLMLVLWDRYPEVSQCHRARNSNDLIVD